MDRLISEQAVIESIEFFQMNPQHFDFVNLIEDIKEIPSAEPKTGHWITARTFMHDGEYYCDKCKCDSPNNEKWDYCPNCGAKMV